MRTIAVELEKIALSSFSFNFYVVFIVTSSFHEFQFPPFIAKLVTVLGIRIRLDPHHSGSGSTSK
jgi:hypothetical protein